MSVCPCLPSPVCLPWSNSGNFLTYLKWLCWRCTNSWTVLSFLRLHTFPCLRSVNVRLTLCACIVDYTTVHPQEMIICLQTAVYSCQHSPQQTCCSMLSGSAQMAFSQKLIWRPLLCVVLIVCCWCCIGTWFLCEFSVCFQPLWILTPEIRRGSKSVAGMVYEHVRVCLSAGRRASSTTEWQMEPWM